MIKIKIEAQNGADLRNQLKQLLGETSEPQAFELKPHKGVLSEAVDDVFRCELSKLVSNNGFDMADVTVNQIFNSVLENRMDKKLDELFESFIDAYTMQEASKQKEVEEKPKKQRTTRKKAEEKTPEPEPEETNEAEAEVAPMPEENEETEAEVAPMPEESEETPEDQPKVTMAEIQTKVQGLVKDGKKPAIIKILENDFKVSRVPDIKESDLPKFYVLISKL